MAVNCGGNFLIIELKTRILARKDTPIAHEIIDVETFLFLLKENEKAIDPLRKATMMHNLLA